MTDRDPREMDTRAITATALGERRPTRWRWVAILAAIVAIASVAFAITDFVGQRDDAQSQTQVAKAATKKVGGTGKDLANKVLLACAGGSKDAQALRTAGLCGEASSTKQEINKAVPGTPGAAGATGATGSTGLPGVRGQDGSPGPAGRDGTSVTGPTGATGATGQTGPAGPPGEDGKDGSDGAPGAAGADGKDGRGIQSARCGDDGRWTVTYSDGTSEDAGSCRADLLPAPSQ